MTAKVCGKTAAMQPRRRRYSDRLLTELQITAIDKAQNTSQATVAMTDAAKANFLTVRYTTELHSDHFTVSCSISIIICIILIVGQAYQVMRICLLQIYFCIAVRK